MLEGVEGRVIRGAKRKEEVGEEGELSRGEIKKVLKTMKNGKAVALHEMPGEIWKYTGEGIEEWVWKFCNRVWKREWWPKG